MNVKVLTFWLYVVLINIIKLVKTGDLQKWEYYKARFGKHYATSEEDKRRMKIFEETLRKIAAHNRMFKKGEVSYEMGINPFSDMTAEEFARTHLSNLTFCNKLNEMSGSELSTGKVASLQRNNRTAPKFKNWVTEGAVTPVKNQDNPAGCSSCWVFPVTGVIESHNFIRTGKLVPLSNQNLLDCVGPGNDCAGGKICDAFKYVINNKGIATEKSYPYTAKKGSCRYKAKNKGAMIRDYEKIESENEEMLKSIVGLIGPVACALYVDNNFILNYKDGVYSSPECANRGINHAALVVGYGTEENKPYWLMKNSWGTEWGLGGYFKLRRGTNECSMSLYNYYPVF